MLSGPIKGVSLQGLVASVPQAREGLEQLAKRFGYEAAERIAKATGIYNRRIAGDGLCTSDLAHAAAARLLKELDWSADSIELLVVVSQTPDHILPSTACLLQERLGLSKECAAFDIGLGCSGFVYGLWNAASLMAANGLRRCLLIVGDTTSRILSPGDRNVAPLFGDAAAAAALSFDPETPNTGPGMVFDLGSDGSGAPYLMVPAGGFRRPSTPATRRRHTDKAGNKRGAEDLFMDGTQVFAFTLREVPRSLEKVMQRAGWDISDVDHFVLHQANAMMNRRLGRKIGASEAQVLIDLADFGNTSSASVALAMAHGLRAALLERPLRLVLSGFGVGWSWATVALTQQPLQACELIEVSEGTTAI